MRLRHPVFPALGEGRGVAVSRLDSRPVNPTGPRLSIGWAVLVLWAAAGLGCGGDPPPPAPAGPSVRTTPVPDLPPAPAEAIVARAFQALNEGPGSDLLRMGATLRLREEAPSGPSQVEAATAWAGTIHSKSLELALADLIALPQATLDYLGQAAVVARITQVHPGNTEAWEAVLDALRRLRAVPFSVLRPYVEPALSSPDWPTTLRRRAARALAGSSAPEAAALLYKALPTLTEDSDGAGSAVARLLRADEATRGKTLRYVLEYGDGKLWTAASAALQSDLRTGELDFGRADALAWWALSAGSSGPRLPDTEPRIKRTGAGLVADYADAARMPSKPGVALGIAPLPRDGWVARPLADMLVLPAMVLLFTGGEPAIDARCRLAMWEFLPAVHAIDRARMRVGGDPRLAARARHCMLPGREAETIADADAYLDAWLANPQPIEDPAGFDRRLAAQAPPSTDPAVVARLRALMAALPEDAAGEMLARRVYNVLRGEDVELPAVLDGWLLGGDPKLARRALGMVLADLDGSHLAAFRTHIERLPPAEAEALRPRYLHWAARALNMTAVERQAVLDELLARFANEPIERIRGEPPILLAFGEEGAEAFAEGLLGPRRALYVDAWPEGHELVPLPLAEALLDPLGPETSEQELRHALGLAFRTFPAAAAPKLAALRTLVPEAYQASVDAVLDRVWLRAAR